MLSDTPWRTGSLTFHHGVQAPNISVQRQESCFLPEVGRLEGSVHDFFLPAWPSARHASHQSMFTIKALHTVTGDSSMGRNHSD